MKSVVAPNTQRMILVSAIAMIVVVPAVATFRSRHATSLGGKLQGSGDLTSHLAHEDIFNPGSRLRGLANAVVNPKLPDNLKIPGRGSVKELRDLAYSEDEINQMWQSFQSSLPGWSQWQNPYGTMLP